jgi:hypothetical protein
MAPQTIENPQSAPENDTRRRLKAIGQTRKTWDIFVGRAFTRAKRHNA